MCPYVVTLPYGTSCTAMYTIECQRSASSDLARRGGIVSWGDSAGGMERGGKKNIEYRYLYERAPCGGDDDDDSV